MLDRTFAHYGTGRDQDDPRDAAYVPTAAALPARVDLRAGCGPVYTQGALKSCSAHALASSLTFLEKKAGRPLVLPSRLFLYYNTRALTHDQGSDSGATLRNAIKALAAVGVCNETLWPYLASNVTEAPPQVCYANATMHALQYFRLSQHDLSHAKACLAEGYPFVCGIEVFEGPCLAATATGHMTMPAADDTKIAGHAVMVVGYDDDTQSVIALNSEGATWGLDGFFTMPYDYLTNTKLAFDLWTIRKMG